MKKKQILLQKSAVLLAGVLLAAGTCACGGGDSAPAGQETADGDTAESTETDTEAEEQQREDAADTETEADTDVTFDAASGETGASPVTVTFEKSREEHKADDGTVLLTTSTQMPVVSIEGGEEAAEKINADIGKYFDTFSYDETLSMAEADYTASLGEDGWEFHGYSTDISSEVTRMDDAVVSFRITPYSYTGGAHGNYGSVCKNYSAKTGELLSLEEIAGDYDTFHAAVLDYISDLAETSAYKDKLYDTPAKDDLDSTLFQEESWLFTRSGISFLAAPYVLGPYASGEIAFMLPYEKAYELGLKEDYRYNGNFVDEHYYIYKYDPETFEPVVDGTPDITFDLDGDGTEEGLAFYGQVTDPSTGEDRYAYYIDGEDYGDVVKDALDGISDNMYLETTYALYHADAPDGGVPAVAVMLTEYGEGEDSEGNPVRSPYSFIFGYTKEKGLYYMYQEDGFVTLPAQP